MKIGYKELIARAEKKIESIGLEEAETLIGDDNTVFVVVSPLYNIVLSVNLNYLQIMK